MNRLHYYLPRVLLSILVFGAVLSLPEVATRVLYRARHGVWPVSLAEIKRIKMFASFPLVRISRLSVMPVGDREWKAILRLSAGSV